MTTHIYENLPEMHPSGIKSSARHLASGVCASDMKKSHADPCQVLADLMTIRERRGALENQKLCFIGDGCSMANSLIVGGLLAGMTVSCVCPQGYRPAADVLMFAHKYGPKFHLLTDPAEGVKDADEIFTEAENRLHVQKAVLAILLANQ